MPSEPALPDNVPDMKLYIISATICDFVGMVEHLCVASNNNPVAPNIATIINKVELVKLISKPIILIGKMVWILNCSIGLADTPSPPGDIRLIAQLVIF